MTRLYVSADRRPASPCKQVGCVKIRRRLLCRAMAVPQQAEQGSTVEERSLVAGAGDAVTEGAEEERSMPSAVEAAPRSVEQQALLKMCAASVGNGLFSDTVHKNALESMRCSSRTRIGISLPPPKNTACQKAAPV